MPQMSPMEWMNLYTLFVVIFLIIMSKVFFFSGSSLFNHSYTIIIKKSNKSLWKW